ncbi:MAG: hypothetical protein L3J89_01395 [Gammaproteobacteria bacterium]|nr:hypothetical protein [Gammaproteobacteria bacterium]
MTYSEQMQKIWAQYESSGMPTPATKHNVAEWAVHNGLWKPRPIDIIGQCADDLAKALREEYKTDVKGRRVRTKHVVKYSKNGKQLYLWADIDTAPRDHMVKAFAQRRKQVVGDCHQLKTDVDYYNDKNSTIEPIQVVLDFTDDVLEMQHAESIDDAA